MTTQTKDPILVFDKTKQKLIKAGNIIGDTFVKKVNRKKHLMRKFNAYGISKEIFIQLEERKVLYILIEEKDGHSYTSYVKDWLNYGLLRDEGHGEQYFLNLSYCRVKLYAHQ